LQGEVEFDVGIVSSSLVLAALQYPERSVLWCMDFVVRKNVFDCFFRVFPKQFRVLSTAARLVGQWKVVRYQKMRTSLLLKRVKVSGQKLR